MLFLLHFEMLVTEELNDRLLINCGLVVVDDWRQIEDELPGLFSFLYLCLCCYLCFCHCLPKLGMFHLQRVDPPLEAARDDT